MIGLNWKWLLVLLLLIFGIGGCSQKAMDSFFAETVTDSRGFHDVQAQRMAEHDAHMSEQHKAMHPEAAAEIDTMRADFDAKLAALQQKSDDNHSSVGTGLAKVATDVLALVQQVAGMFMGFPPNTTVAGFVGKEVVAGMKVSAAAVTSLGADVDQLEDDMDAKLAALDADLQLKLAHADDNTIARLTALKGDSAAFRAALKQELSLTPDDMAQLQGMTTEQILALIGAALGAAVAGGAVGKTGKSRGQADIDKIKDELSAITTAAAGANAAKAS